eukprot:TRINITY_DN9580_c1_g1_i2.p3 TRINITY_DN9580_c1_g1~~TRINITY_DN9580_c1_g1_i2.p3  ORF type:complete len:164 (-),score=4.06 TRINITY_DN9580_c1_g1_i2:3-494(-)
MIFAFAMNCHFKDILEAIKTIEQFNSLVQELFGPVKILPTLQLISEKVEIISYNVTFIRDDGRRILPFIGQVRNIEMSPELKEYSKFNLFGKAVQNLNFARVKYELSDMFVKQIVFLLLPFGVYIQNKKLEVQNHIMENEIQNGLKVDLSNLSFLPAKFHYLT